MLPDLLVGVEQRPLLQRLEKRFQKGESPRPPPPHLHLEVEMQGREKLLFHRLQMRHQFVVQAFKKQLNRL